MTIRILLLGNTGQLGWELERSLSPLGELNACDYPAIDLADLKSLHQLIHSCGPQLIINATAYTAVDRAESEPEQAHLINSAAPGALAEEARNINSALIHYSTDYVFDGLKGSPYLESDQPHPLGVYGQTKLAGEQAIQQVGGAYLILRTSWVYSLRRDSFVTKVLQWAQGKPPLRLVTDQVSGPTWARMLAEATSQLIAQGHTDPLGYISDHRGLYHLAGAGYCSRLEWGQQVLSQYPHPERLTIHEISPALTSEFPTPATRPSFSALNCDNFLNTFGFQLPDWRLALKLAMESL
ncbi:MAG: dTDP-4-dehydrorhamnose reductase [Anaerolineales bacterium]|nr:dTDP-4-dehydrorhamnose reductase [Anaerolineae bacterium]PWB50273.1 MAG: dTDP-4-dehydrorhamnose reductase [Anaerolineales bacterium]